MVTLGGGPSFPLSGENGALMGLLALLVILGALWLMMRVFEF